MNSQESRKVKASSASTTRFMPARNAGKNGSTRSGRLFVAAVAEAVEAGGGAAEIDDDEEEGRERVEPEMGADPGQAERQRRAPSAWRRRRRWASAKARRTRRNRRRRAVDGVRRPRPAACRDR